MIPAFWNGMAWGSGAIVTWFLWGVFWALWSAFFRWVARKVDPADQALREMRERLRDGTF